MKRIFCLCAAMALLNACAAVPEDHFYALAMPEANAPPMRTAYTIAIDAVSVPQVVDRPQIVLFEDDNRVKIVEHERWAEPLRAAIPAAIARALRAQLPDARVAVYPQAAAADASCRIGIDVQRMESRRGESALIEALWSLRCTGQPAQYERSFVRENVQGDSYEALVAAHARGLAQIGQEMTQALRQTQLQPMRK